eukprot:gene5825-6264_t
MRRIPGPASRLSQDRVHINGENTPNLSIQTTTEILSSPTQSNHFLVISALRSLFGLSSDDLARDVTDILRTYCLAPISDVQEGLHDLVIAGLVAVIEEVSVAYDGSVSLSLQDGTGSVNGFLSPEEMARLQQAEWRYTWRRIPSNDFSASHTATSPL